MESATVELEAAPHDAIAPRLLGVARELLAQGLALYEVEARIFAALRPGGTSPTAVRGRLFRLMVGLTETPLSKAQASDLTDAVMQVLRPAPDLEFSQLMVRARLANDLLQCVFDEAENLRRQRIEVTRENLKTAIMLSIISACPRSNLISWHSDNPTVEAILEGALDDYFGKTMTDRQTQPLDGLENDIAAMHGPSVRAALGLNGQSSEQAPPIADARPWPAKLDEPAFHGLAGLFARIVEPHSEADVAALLVSFLVGAGNLIGRRPYQIAEAAHHYTNQFAVLVGETSHGRKGSALAQAFRLFRLVDPDWASTHIGGGLASGEGLIHAVRDPVERREPIKERGKVTGYQAVEVDSGVSDKRLLVVEPEFAGVLKVCARQGNLLSNVLRKAWDSGDLDNMSKGSPARATGAHISAIGHVTRAELLRGLDNTEAANGLFNRFLWICVRRSKLLPHGGTLRDSDLIPMADSLRSVIAWCSMGDRHIAFSEDAAEAWTRVYPKLSSGRPGLLGAVLGRAEAQTLRLACLYAALDCSPTIELDHLRAALAVWQYCEDSAAFVFGDRLGDPDSDAILVALRANPSGLSRTQIQGLFSRNLSVGRLAAALASLLKGNLATVRQVATNGRPAEIWEARKDG